MEIDYFVCEMCISIHIVVIYGHLGKSSETFCPRLIVTLIKECSHARLGIVSLIPMIRVDYSVWVGLKPRLFPLNQGLNDSGSLFAQFSLKTSDSEVHMNLARYGLRCMKLILQHKPLAIAWSCCAYSKVVIATRFSTVL